MQDGWDPPSWKSTRRHFFCWGWSDFDKISQTGAEWHVDCGDMVKIETRCRIPILCYHIWWTKMYNTADVWANSMACHPRATCHIAGCCHLANSMSWSQSYVWHCRVLPSGEFNGICHPRATYHITGCCHLVNSLSWFQSYMPHGKINVTIVPHCRV